MAAVALIKFTQGPNTDSPGVAVEGTLVDGSVTVTNGDNTDVASWVIYMLDAPPDSTEFPIGDLPLILAQAVSGTPTTAFDVDVPGTYRVMLDVLDAGAVRNRDIRCFGVRNGQGVIIPPYQKNPDPLPLALPGVIPNIVSPATKPDEQNYGGQPRGWSGDRADGQIEELFKNALGIRETSGPTLLTIGAIANGEVLTRSGSTVVGQSGGVPVPLTLTLNNIENNPTFALALVNNEVTTNQVDHGGTENTPALRLLGHVWDDVGDDDDPFIWEIQGIGVSAVETAPATLLDFRATIDGTPATIFSVLHDPGGTVKQDLVFSGTNARIGAPNGVFTIQSQHGSDVWSSSTLRYFNFIGSSGNYEFRFQNTAALTINRTGTVPTVSFGSGYTAPVINHTNTASTAADMAIRAQGSTAGTNAGGVLHLQGGRRNSTGLKGGVRLQLNPDDSAFESMAELVEVAASRRVLSLVRGANLTTTQMPANTGDRVLYIADAGTVPTADPVTGHIYYSTAGGPAWRMAGGAAIIFSSTAGSADIQFSETAVLPTIRQLARTTNGTAATIRLAGQQLADGTTSGTAGLTQVNGGDVLGTTGTRTGGELHLRGGSGSNPSGGLGVGGDVTIEPGANNSGGTGSGDGHIRLRDAPSTKHFFDMSKATEFLLVEMGAGATNYSLFFDRDVTTNVGLSQETKDTSGTGAAMLLTAQPGSHSAANQVAGALTTTGGDQTASAAQTFTGGAAIYKAGDATGANAGGTFVGGKTTVRGGDATGGSGTRNGGDLDVRPGNGATAQGLARLLSGGSSVRFSWDATGIAWFGTTPIAQPADMVALTDNSGGTADRTIQALTDPADAPVAADNLRDDLVANLIPELRNNFADIADFCNDVRTFLRNYGLMA